MSETDIDITVLVQKANEIRAGLQDLKNYTSTNLESFLKDSKLIDATKYKFLLTIEGCISICTHLASRLGKKVPDSYSECFKIIFELGLISKSLADNLMEMAKFRNLLIHIYWTVDDEKVYNYSKNNLSDIEQFLKEIGSSLKEKI